MNQASRELGPVEGEPPREPGTGPVGGEAGRRRLKAEG